MILVFQISLNYVGNEKEPIFEYTLDSLQSVVFSGNEDKFWNQEHSESCDPELIKSREASTEVYLQEKVRIIL